jgi:RimJ/RimL family protein N-acetyltransferase
MNQSPTLITDRLVLRKPAEKDIQDRFRCGRSREIVRMYGGDTSNLKPYTMADAENWYHEMMKNPLEWAIEYKGNCIGQARLSVNHQDRRARYAVGIFDEQLLNKGIGTEVTKAILKYAFETLKLHRVDLRVLEYNKRAISCYQKCGFIKEGVEREGAFIEGKWESDWMMSILEQEYYEWYGAR